MPVYEYVCQSCQHEFEELKRSFSDAAVEHCPSCGKGPITRKLSVFAARQSEAGNDSFATPGGCGRCGDPAGPCAM